MNLEHFLVILSILIAALGTAAYMRDTLAGRSKPNRISWSMWALAPLVSTGAALSIHADVWATARIFFAGFFPLLIFAASFLNKQSYWKLTAFDLLCGLCSATALIVWALVNSPRAAILLGALGDGFACFPTIVKAWKHPKTETGSTYIASLVSTLLVIPAIPRWDIENSAFEIYLIAANTLLVVAVYRDYFFGKRK